MCNLLERWMCLHIKVSLCLLNKRWYFSKLYTFEEANVSDPNNNFIFLRSLQFQSKTASEAWPWCIVCCYSPSSFNKVRTWFYAGSNLALDESESCDVGNLWQWSCLEIRLTVLAPVNHFTKPNFHHLKRTSFQLVKVLIKSWCKLNQDV